jgi:argininosuccinate lyase
MQIIDARIPQEVFNHLGVENSVKSRTSFGGTSPDNVREQAKLAKARLLS